MDGIAESSRISERELMGRIVAREQEALSTLYQRYSAMVYGLALRILDQEKTAEEVTQDVFLKVWNQANRWDESRGKLATWLLMLTRYAAIDRQRLENRKAPWSGIEIEDALNLLGNHNSIDEVRLDNQRVLQSLMQDLPEPQRVAIELAFYKGMTHSEIAEQLNEPLGTVKSRVRMGLQKLKDSWIESVSEDQPLDE